MCTVTATLLPCRTSRRNSCPCVCVRPCASQMLQPVKQPHSGRQHLHASPYRSQLVGLPPRRAGDFLHCTGQPDRAWGSGERLE